MNFTPILLVDRRRGRMLHAIFRLDSPPTRAQTSTGEIVITVVDPSEAVVPNAQVTLTGTETGNVVRRLATNHAGIANAPLLPPQTYDIVVAAAGFNNLVRNGIVLHVGEALSLRLDLQPGAVTQSVTVVGETPMLDEASGTLAQVIEPRQILQLPLNGRNYLELGRLTMGAVPSHGSRDQTFSTYGNSGIQNAFLLNGARNQNYLRGLDNRARDMLRPPLDALAEFSGRPPTFQPSMERRPEPWSPPSPKAGPISCTGRAMSSCATALSTRGTFLRLQGRSRSWSRTRWEDPRAGRSGTTAPGSLAPTKARGFATTRPSPPPSRPRP